MHVGHVTLTLMDIEYVFAQVSQLVAQHFTTDVAHVPRLRLGLSALAHLKRRYVCTHTVNFKAMC